MARVLQVRMCLAPLATMYILKLGTCQRCWDLIEWHDNSNTADRRPVHASFHHLQSVRRSSDEPSLVSFTAQRLPDRRRGCLIILAFFCHAGLLLLTSMLVTFADALLPDYGLGHLLHQRLAGAGPDEPERVQRYQRRLRHGEKGAASQF